MPMGLRMSAIEALVNATLGLIISWGVTFYALPFFGLHPSAATSAGITALYFSVSFLRAWAIREVFRRVFS